MPGCCYVASESYRFPDRGQILEELSLMLHASASTLVPSVRCRRSASSMAILATSSHRPALAASVSARASAASTMWWRLETAASSPIRPCATLGAFFPSDEAGVRLRTLVPCSSSNRPESSEATTGRALTSTTGHGPGTRSGADRASLCAIVPVPSASNPALSADISDSDHVVPIVILSSLPTGCPEFRSAIASLSVLGTKCMYRSVMLSVECPASS